MAQQIINIGNAPNDGLGDTARQAGGKINANFTEVYQNISDILANGVPGGGGGGDGSVTSVGVSGSNGISVTGSPVTGAGIISLSIDASTLRSHLNVADGATANTGTVTSVAIAGGGTGITVVSGSPISTSGTITLGIDATTLRSTLNVANGATANAADAFLLDRTNHTGTQAISTIASLQTTLDGLSADDASKLSSTEIDQTVATTGTSSTTAAYSPRRVTNAIEGYVSTNGIELSNATSGEILAGTTGLDVGAESIAKLASSRNATADIVSNVLTITLPTVASPNNAALNIYCEVAANTSFVLDAVPAEYVDKHFFLTVTFFNTSGSTRTLTPIAATGSQPPVRIPTDQPAMTVAASAYLIAYGYYNPDAGPRVTWTVVPSTAVT